MNLWPVWGIVLYIGLGSSKQVAQCWKAHKGGGGGGGGGLIYQIAEHFSSQPNFE